jgi:hypothetical protein
MPCFYPIDTSFDNDMHICTYNSTSLFCKPVSQITDDYAVAYDPRNRSLKTQTGKVTQLFISLLLR